MARIVEGVAWRQAQPGDGDLYAAKQICGCYPALIAWSGARSPLTSCRMKLVVPAVHRPLLTSGRLKEGVDDGIAFHTPRYGLDSIYRWNYVPGLGS